MARPTDQALVASQSSPQAVSTEGFDPSRGATLAFCGPSDCIHDFAGWLAFDDGLGGEQVCTKCGAGAFDPWGGE